ncbi:MAG: glycosyl hydrolase [Saprospiraceae bacterium]|nr:glycosyl hydrolase [Saprospiraceae bacterium]
MKLALPVFLTCSLILSCANLSVISAQAAKKEQTSKYQESFYDALEYRCIGPFRGGRSCTVTGVPGKPNLYYFGSAGGGIWQTKDGGRNWENISDGFFGGSIGAIAVSASDPNVIYVGGGEQTLRGNVSYGYGVWRSVDAGKTWKMLGLPESRHVSRIRIHPNNPDIVYVAALGNIFAPNEERGIFRSMDGGENWEKVLYINDRVGAADLILDPNNPRILYASTWNVYRNAYEFSSGGEGSGIWKSTDSGTTWENISENEGLATGTLGIIGLAVSPVNSDRIWALVEAAEGGVFRSDDAGKTWKRINSDRDLRQRAWYYTRIYADPEDEDVVYVLNVNYHKSKDGGKTFSNYNAPHGDHHDLWIAPEDPQRMIVGDDGGAQVSFDGGETWTTYYNQPTAQLYRLTTDNHFPFRIYAAQQDNSTVRIPYRTKGYSIRESDWESTAGCECGHIAVDPRNADIVYGGCYDGFIERKDHANDLSRNVSVWPDNPMGHGAEGMRYRFQWNFPILISPHDPNKLYAASNHLHVSYNEGQSWELISPDLTTNDSTKIGSSGGPITQDNTSVEYYCTIFAVAESPVQKDVIWTGSDDGLLHITKDGGKTWTNVTPAGLPKWTQINSLEADPFEAGGLYLAATSYKSGDFQPYLYKTKDFGATWTRIDRGIDREHFTRVIRTDPAKRNLLYAGTESGLYISFDDGSNWQPFQLNLPIVPVTDLAVKESHLIVATQGRSIWVLDDLTVLYQQERNMQPTQAYLFAPQDSYRMEGGQARNPGNNGTNHTGGVQVYYYLPELADSIEVSLRFLDAAGSEIRKFSTKATDKKDKLKTEAGSNMFVWNTQYPGGKDFEGMILWWASLRGPSALPGRYEVQLQVGKEVQSHTFELLQDPRSPASMQDLEAQFAFSQEVLTKVSEAHTAIGQVKDLRKQLKTYTDRLDDKEEYQELKDMAAQIDSVITQVEQELYQTQNQSGQDPLNFPIRLTNKLAHLNAISSGDYPPTDQAIAVKEELIGLVDTQLAILSKIFEEEVPRFNQRIRDLVADTIILKSETE